MSEQNKCPICDKPLIEFEDIFHDQHILMEASSACPDSHYATYYHTGHYETHVFGVVFHWNYNTSEKEVEWIEKKILEAIEFYKEMNKDA